MKKIINLALIGLMLLSSCSTYQNLTVTGKPGTTIYSPSYQKLAIVDNRGKAKFKISRDLYYAYLLSQEANSNTIIPFALDYKNKNYLGTRVASATGFTIFSCGLAGVLAGSIAALDGDEDSANSILTYALPATVIGGAIWGFSEARLNEVQRDYKFKYLSTHQTNENINFIPFIDDGISKNTNAKSPNKDNIQNTSLNTDETSPIETTTIAKSRTSKSNKTFSYFSKQIEGSYIGTGKLIHQNNIIEQYQNIKVVIKRIDKTNVSVNVIESNGEAFFNSKCEYNRV